MSTDHQDATKGVLFDLDGTLTDPKEGIEKSIRYAMKEMGRPLLDTQSLDWCIGLPLRDALSTLLQTTDSALVEKALALYRERFGAVGLYENRLYDGIPEALCELREGEYRTYVATSKPEAYASKIIDHFGISDLFSRVYGSELNGTRSDKGELIAHVLQSEGLPPARVVMIGDRKHDVVGAAKHGVRCIGVSHGYGTEEEPRESGAIAIADSPQNIPGLIRQAL